MKKEISISVRGLVEFILRSGDITSGRGGFADREAMQEGTRLHQKIQKKMGPMYEAEVPVVYRREFDDFILKLDGRADGVIREDGEIWIDEIKGRYHGLEFMQEPVPVHLAQAKCYAWILGREYGQESMGVQMTYCRMESSRNTKQIVYTAQDLQWTTSNDKIRHFRFRYTMEELDAWFTELLEAQAMWIREQMRWQKLRDESMQSLQFPFAYRKGQKELVSGIYRTIVAKKELFVQAPTGVGKTMSAMYPAIRSMGSGMGDRIFYLTAKTITRTVAEEAVSILQNAGLSFRAVTLTAKEKLCILDTPECNPGTCPRAKGHYDRVNAAVYEMLTEQSVFTREAILAQAEKWQVCPHEFQLDVSLWMDAVICDYNYVFDPRVRLKRFFADSMRTDSIFLIDEAHNLVDRGREMFSASLVKEDILVIKKEIHTIPETKGLEKILNRVNKLMLEMKRECEGLTRLSSVAAFALQLENLIPEMEELLERLEHGKSYDLVLDFYFQVRTFLNVYELLDENYVIYTTFRENGDFELKLFCVNPAANLQAAVNQGRSAVFFSATLLPVKYYQSMFSTNSDDYTVYIDSPFAQENRCLLVGTGASTRYTRRGREEYLRIAAYIHNVVQAKKGNYMVFFPSYRLMQEVFDLYEEAYQSPDVILRQQQNLMTETDREEFLELFAAEQENTLVGFCIMGGIFSEGIDLDGEKLIGSIVVGTGIPQVGPERELLKNFFDEKGENGFNYAYRYPGMNKVQQAAGRVIRTVTDRGVILLLDDRFPQSENLRLFPREWKNYYPCRTPEDIPEILKKFWES